MSDGGHDGQGGGTKASYDAGPEEGGTLAGGPAQVAEGRLPEEGRSAGHVWVFLLGSCGVVGGRVWIEVTEVW